jgi:hypothetical protein
MVSPAPSHRKTRLRRLATAAVLGCAMLAPGTPRADPMAPVDTALILAVDVSSSVDERRYALQMEGIAQALEDPGVQSAILGAPNGAILLSMVTWADRPKVSLPWLRIASEADAVNAARRVRALPLEGGEFTCLAQMFRFLDDKILTRLPAKANRVVIDVSGDGVENCNPDTAAKQLKDSLIASRATVNGLPILEGKDAEMLEGWYAENVVGGPGSFNLPANGYEDFARAIRQKFVNEIAGAMPKGKLAAVSR